MREGEFLVDLTLSREKSEAKMRVFRQFTAAIIALLFVMHESRVAMVTSHSPDFGTLALPL